MSGAFIPCQWHPYKPTKKTSQLFRGCKIPLESRGITTYKEWSRRMFRDCRRHEFLIAGARAQRDHVRLPSTLLEDAIRLRSKPDFHLHVLCLWGRVSLGRQRVPLLLPRLEILLPLPFSTLVKFLKRQRRGWGWIPRIADRFCSPVTSTKYARHLLPHCIANLISSNKIGLHRSVSRLTAKYVRLEVYEWAWDSEVQSHRSVRSPCDSYVFYSARAYIFFLFAVCVLFGLQPFSASFAVRVRFCLQRTALLSLKCGFEFVRSVRTVSV